LRGKAGFQWFRSMKNITWLAWREIDAIDRPKLKMSAKLENQTQIVAS
jgi:hypothetical protein